MALHPARKGAILVAALFALAMVFSVFGTAYTVITTQHTVRALCAEQYDVAIAPVQPTSTKLGTEIVIHFRDAYTGLGCGSLPPPSPLLVQLAGKYHLTIRR